MEKLNFEIKENKVIIKGPKLLESFVNNFKAKFKEILDKELEFEEESVEKKEEKNKIN